MSDEQKRMQVGKATVFDATFYQQRITDLEREVQYWKDQYYSVASQLNYKHPRKED